ncbi:MULTISPECIES: glycosyltransferase [Streptococcus]|jgi:glucosyltransferase|uniref:Glycosyltransferase family 2 protein n=1 Tax=Streptococcus koreensis TaxID=2382163 RepID=A0ABM6ZA55_9STRE|nr:MULTISPECIES: glycosyltransferase family 2 protein [Streptococcus]AYF94343.1 glycosyltransferase family 2 protein [Streptococcus koreensis]RJU24811.1 glycosyltransferase family 2 protein [Streptococcus sp. AM43-2AT]
METTPFVSIICTVFNKEPWLKKTIDSFLAQKTEFLFEIILVDDASTDGSRKIIADYQASHPDLIRAFYQDENLGIAKTWVTICKEARGQYIARCDGDDFWIDPLKLQKQVDLLASKPDCKWSNTDFDIYDEHGNFVSKAGFANQTIPLADTYEKMLATRGFTMASTWLVDRDLMIEVNQELDLTTSDDTFNLQLELFQRTSLAYLNEATVAYTINQGSDSRPCDFRKLERRFHKLLQTQLTYLDKYPNADFKEMTKILLDRTNTYEIRLSKPMDSLSHIGMESVTIYFGDEENTYSEDRTMTKLLQKEDNFIIDIPKGTSVIRVDLSERPSYYSEVELKDTSGKLIHPVYTNGVISEGYYLFSEPDPQLIYDVEPEEAYQLNYKMISLDNPSEPDYIGKVFAAEMLDCQNRLKNLESELEATKEAYNTVIHSRRWTIPTKILKFLRIRK